MSFKAVIVCTQYVACHAVYNKRVNQQSFVTYGTNDTIYLYILMWVVMLVIRLSLHYNYINKSGLPPVLRSFYIKVCNLNAPYNPIVIRHQTLYVAILDV